MSSNEITLNAAQINAQLDQTNSADMQPAREILTSGIVNDLFL